VEKKGNDINVCFALAQRKLGRLGLRLNLISTIFFFFRVDRAQSYGLGWIQPTRPHPVFRLAIIIYQHAYLNCSCTLPTWSSSIPAGHYHLSARVFELFMHASYMVRVIKMIRGETKSLPGVAGHKAKDDGLLAG
jgi:hypothetical protein